MAELDLHPNHEWIWNGRVSRARYCLLFQWHYRATQSNTNETNAFHQRCIVDFEIRPFGIDHGPLHDHVNFLI